MEILSLDKEYASISSAEQTLQNLLAQLQKEERALRTAVSQASETLIAKRSRQKRERESEAISRLEVALGLDFDEVQENVSS